MICAGIDAGSRATKVVLFDSEQSRIVGSGLADQGVEQQRLAAELLERTCQDAQVDRAAINAIVATGYGRNAVRFADTTITEITCHAQGVHHLAPEARTIVEIGGQDSKFITLEDGGRVRDFAMNDRCAAGSGRFLEVVAARLGVDLSTLGDLSRDSRQAALISSMCVVFAETEIIGLLAEGVAPADIAAGVQNAIALRVATLAGRTVTPPGLLYRRRRAAIRHGPRPGNGLVLRCLRLAPPAIHRRAGRRHPGRPPFPPQPPCSDQRKLIKTSDLRQKSTPNHCEGSPKALPEQLAYYNAITTLLQRYYNDTTTLLHRYYIAITSYRRAGGSPGLPGDVAMEGGRGGGPVWAGA